jgi:hypothetical protein
MKKLSFIMTIMALTSMETKGANFTNDNPWHTFKDVLHTYETSTGQFLLLSSDKQVDFLNAADAMKAKISKHESEFAKEKLKRIDVAVNVFKFIWNSKSVPEEMAGELEIPVAPAID